MTQTSTKPRSADEIVTSLRMTREQHDALKALAARENRSVSGQLRHVIEQLTDEPETKAAA